MNNLHLVQLMVSDCYAFVAVQGPLQYPQHCCVMMLISALFFVGTRVAMDGKLIGSGGGTRLAS